jgi:tRNA threonylcarbamoyladenosine biosynthesis protein TsaB
VGSLVNVLAIETATTSCAIALRLNSGEEREVVLDGGRRHTETLMPGVQQLLREHDLKASELDRVVIDRGPGLYTGLRVGVATAIGLGLATRAELVAVTSLEVLAREALDGGVEGTLVAAVDARRGELFVQTFSLHSSLMILGDPVVTTAESLVAEWSDGEESIHLCGDGAARYEEQFAALGNTTVLDLVLPSPRVAIEVASTRGAQETVVPLYLREADAVANFSTRERP